MARAHARCAVIIFFLVCTLCALSPAQQPDSDSSTVNDGNADQSESLASLARKARKDHTQQVQISDADAKKLFESVDKIFAFAAEDTGFAKRASVKRRLIGSADVEQFTREQEAKKDIAQRFETTEMTMKKFGFVPRDFNLKSFLVKANGKQLAAYYDSETKTISLLNWIPLEQQAPILAHELTHALQDQNYGLRAFLKEPEGAESGARIGRRCPHRASGSGRGTGSDRFRGLLARPAWTQPADHAWPDLPNGRTRGEGHR